MAAVLSFARPPPSSPVRDHTRPSPSVTPDSLQNYVRKASHGRCPEKLDVISAMKSCVHLSYIPSGQAIHAHIIKYGFATDHFIATSTIDFYSACGLLHSARQLFDRIPHRDVVLWTAMLISHAENGDIAGASKLFDEMPLRDSISRNAMMSSYLKCGFPEETLKLFHKLLIDNLNPNEATLITALTACSRIGFLAPSEPIHGYISKVYGCQRSATLSNSLANMYAKCGRFDAALSIFVHQESKNLESWNTLLTGCALSGLAKSSFSLFSHMIKNGVRPDRVTLLALLMSCSHAGTVDEAVSYIAGFVSVYCVEPGKDHYGCLVDVFSRSGRLYEARKIIEGLGIDSDVSCWGALLRGCFSYGKHELGLEAGEQLLELGRCDESRYIAVSNLVTAMGEAGEAMKVRKKIGELGIRQSLRVSMIETGGQFHRFISGDTSHSLSWQIYAALESLHSNMRLEQENELMHKV